MPEPKAVADMAVDHDGPLQQQDGAILSGMADAVRAAGTHMLTRFEDVPDLTTREEVVAAIYANDDASLNILKPRLRALRPDAGWVEDELESGPIGAGEWWVTDPVEGNVNHCHGLPDWAVTATLVRDDMPVATTIYIPLTNQLYSAVKGGGATRDGVRLRPSSKADLTGALVGTGQARPGESSRTFDQLGASVSAMLRASLVVRASVPATLQLVHVASGRMEAFWQFSQVRSGLLAGALLVTEAGGLVTDVCGRPWGLDSPDFLASAPKVHTAAVEVLATTR